MAEIRERCRAANPCRLDSGDVAPASGPDGSIDVADVLRLLRLATGLDPVDAVALERGDVAPARLQGEAPALATPLGTEPRALDVTDVLLTLRAAVGLVVFGVGEAS